ncbi:MAG TPA: hypothetical protein PL078_05640 [Bacillota bacterium]|jgi:rubrerythrin|nr:hypothetical protein [Peptococcaceae bacterium MAG4]NLW37425.1 hypothetical protein [Peptococcaceae bacterium]HPZ43469.1 hypothetical protein [Bacillota bacterium]HQD76871.1 hypothetical protein [Bacillota bacterium]HUM58628.1 hypothetical protein [Bacillota bacterium]
MTNNQESGFVSYKLKLSQGDLLSYALKEALLREDQRLARYLHLANNLRDRRLKQLFGEFAATSAERLKQLNNLMKQFNIK